MEIRKNIELKWFMLTVRFMMWKLEVRVIINTWLHCRRGYHKITPDGLKITKSGAGYKRAKVVLNLKWSRCLNCQILFFLTKEDKEKYVKYYDEEEKHNRKIIKSLLHKSH